MKPTISKPFKSNDRTFDKVYNAFDKRDYFNSQGLAKVQIGNFERALKKNDKGAQQVLDLFKGDEKKAKDYITQVISDRNKERAFNNYKALKSAVDSIQKGKPNVGAVDYVKRIIHNSSQKYSIALYSTLRNKKFTKWKDVHNDIDSLVSESVNEGIKIKVPGNIIKKVKKNPNDVYQNSEYAADGSRISYFSDKIKNKYYVVYHGKKYEVAKHIDIKGNPKKFDGERYFQDFVKKYDRTKKLESVNELSDKDIKKAEHIRKSMPGFVGEKFAKKASNEDILAFADLQDKEAQIYNSKIKPIRDAKKKLYKKYRIRESVNEAYIVLYSPKKGVKPVSTAAYKDKKDAEKWAKDLGGITMIVKKKVKGIDEGKKRYYQQDRVGSAKYTISYHDGKKKHKDGSDFFDIQTFKNKKDLAKFVNTLHKGGYVYGFNESVNEGTKYKVGQKTPVGKIIGTSVWGKGRKQEWFYDVQKPGHSPKQYSEKSLDKIMGESVNEAASKEAMGIAALTGTRGSAVQDFIDKNRINSRKLFNALKKANLQGRINFASALAGKPNNPNARLTKKLFGEDKNQIIQIKKKVGKSETKFYDTLSTIEKKLGKRKYRIWLEKSLKDFGENPKHYDYRTNASIEEKLFQVAK